MTNLHVQRTIRKRKAKFIKEEIDDDEDYS